MHLLHLLNVFRLFISISDEKLSCKFWINSLNFFFCFSSFFLLLIFFFLFKFCILWYVGFLGNFSFFSCYFWDNSIVFCSCSYFLFSIFSAKSWENFSISSNLKLYLSFSSLLFSILFGNIFLLFLRNFHIVDGTNKFFLIFPIFDLYTVYILIIFLHFVYFAFFLWLFLVLWTFFLFLHFFLFLPLFLPIIFFFFRWADLNHFAFFDFVLYILCFILTLISIISLSRSKLFMKYFTLSLLSIVGNLSNSIKFFMR